MKKKVILKYILPVIFYFGIVGGGYYYFLLPQINRNNVAKVIPDKSFGWKFPVAKFPLTGSEKNLIAYSDIRDPGGVPQGLPVRLKIPSIGVDSAIEDAHITPDGRMDVPEGSVNVAWFSLGPHPGQVGSAVIGGHFGISNGVPWVFYNLDKLGIGNKIYIVDDKGDTLAFVVRKIELFDRNADSTTVFTSSDGIAHLNLITCEGVWNQVNGTYPDRRVVFTDAIPNEGAVVVNKLGTVATKPREATPTPTLIPTIALIASSEAEIATPSSEKTSSLSAQMLIASAKSLFETPKDGAITSLLLITIIFFTFKIIRSLRILG